MMTNIKSIPIPAHPNRAAYDRRVNFFLRSYYHHDTILRLQHRPTPNSHFHDKSIPVCIQIISRLPFVSLRIISSAGNLNEGENKLPNPNLTLMPTPWPGVARHRKIALGQKIFLQPSETIYLSTSKTRLLSYRLRSPGTPPQIYWETD